MTDPT